MSTVEEARPRSYGNILKPRSAGLWHLGLLSTGMALGLFVVDVIVMFVAGVIAGVAAIVVDDPDRVSAVAPRRAWTDGRGEADRGGYWAGEPP